MSGAPVFWFTGLSGAGKSTLADGVRRALERRGQIVRIFDGDDVRSGRHRHLGFSAEDIKTNNALIAELCRTHRHDCDAILVPIISPFAESRRAARRLLEPGFFEIYVRADLDTLSGRDTKGLYARAARNEIGNLIGVSPCAPFEPPPAPDLVLETGRETVARSTARIVAFVTRQLATAGAGEGPAEG